MSKNLENNRLELLKLPGKNILSLASIKCRAHSLPVIKDPATVTERGLDAQQQTFEMEHIVVIDNGSGTCKVGFAGRPAPER